MEHGARKSHHAGNGDARRRGDGIRARQDMRTTSCWPTGAEVIEVKANDPGDQCERRRDPLAPGAHRNDVQEWRFPRRRCLFTALFRSGVTRNQAAKEENPGTPMSRWTLADAFGSSRATRWPLLPFKISLRSPNHRPPDGRPIDSHPARLRRSRGAGQGSAGGERRVNRMASYR